MKDVFAGKMLLAYSVDEVTINGMSYVVGILTEPKTTYTGYGNIQAPWGEICTSSDRIIGYLIILVILFSG